MRAVEWINVAYFCFLSLTPWVVSRSPQRRFRATALGFAGIALTLAGQLTSRLTTPATANVIRDWLPAGLMILAYRQAGSSAADTNARLQDALLRFDEVLLKLLRRVPKRVRNGISCYLEFAYLFCYPMIPLGLGILYMHGMKANADHFWAVVLPPTYICYATLPFLQLQPPWLARPGRPTSGNPLRSFNFWIVNHLSIRIDTFPSAHVAASFATALAVSSVTPRIGLPFFLIAVSIAIASFVERYHYAIDVLLGVLVVVFTALLEAKTSF